VAAVEFIVVGLVGLKWCVLPSFTYKFMTGVANAGTPP